jgi:citrate synthase
VIASTGADAGACFAGALGALAGPLHGGAPSRVLDTLDEIEAAGVDRLEAILAAKLAGRERLMGFGHAVYRTADPRSALLAEVARELGGPRVALCERLQEVAERLLTERHPDRPLRANVELFAAVVLEACGLPRELFTPAFAMSRSLGWGAHVVEQAAERKLIRPSARYVGPPAPAPLPELAA